MSDLKRWRVTGPDGFEHTCKQADERTALRSAFMGTDVDLIHILIRAGYRAEPIEEPKMMTVPAEDLRVALSWWTGSDTFPSEEKAALIRLRAALEDAK